MTDSADFFLDTMEITIPAGLIPSSGADCVNVSATNDDLVESDDEFDIVITSTSNSNVLPGAASVYTVTITDDDGINDMHCT